MNITPGKYTQDQISSMGLDFNEVTSAQTVNGKSYKLDNPGDGSRVVREVQLQNGGQGSGGFTNPGAAPSGMPSLNFNQPTIDLPGIYKNLYDSSGITDTQNRISQAERQFFEARAKLTDNPFLGASQVDKRLQRLQQSYEGEVAPLKNEMAMKQADIETQLNLQSKQFDINSQQAQQAMNQFNNLLSMGALDNATPEDIANITRSTGISSSMVQGAIQTAKASRIKDVPTKMVTYDDGTSQGFAIINEQTGEVISQQNIAGSKPTKAGGGTKTDAKNEQVADAQYLVTLYQNTNKSNPSWKKAHDLRNQYSPNDFYNMLLTTYPEASSYIKSIKGMFIKK